MNRVCTGLLVGVVILGLVPGPARASQRMTHREQAVRPPEETLHVVQRGETLFSIAQRYGSTVDALAHANGISDPTRIFVGQRLTIPGFGVEIDPDSISTYLVEPGDSLTSIARHYATSWQALARLNFLTSPHVLYPGQVIQVPAVGDVGGRRGRLYIVGAGETLLEIALRQNVLPSRLMSANNLRNPALIYSGQPLLIPGEEMGGLPAPFVSIDVQPLPVAQGGSLVVAVRAERPVTLTGRLFGRTVHFAEENGVHYGLTGVHVFTEPGLYDMALTSTDGEGRATEITVDVVVGPGQFGYERLQVAPSLLDPAVVTAERERLDALRPTFTRARAWWGAFEPPCDGTISSYFGTRRAYNEGPYTSYHGGVDLRGVTGTPVRAPAGGRVVLADQLAVRGNALVIDHGWGVMTGYWHLSKIDVELGQQVEQGDLVARIGNTGLSTGSHLHWEMWVGGVTVNPMQWLDPFYRWPEREGRSDEGDVP